MTADYTVAPGLGVYAEIDLIEDELWSGVPSSPNCTNDATVFIAGAKLSF